MWWTYSTRVHLRAGVMAEWIAPTDEVKKIMLARHFLWHERKSAALLLQRRATWGETNSFNQNYGVEGVMLTGAACATGIPGALLGFFGLTLLIVSGGQGMLIPAGYSCGVISLVAIAMSLIRVLQAEAAGRRFRGERPRQKAASWK
jgi:hypothetical protein